MIDIFEKIINWFKRGDKKVTYVENATLKYYVNRFRYSTKRRNMITGQRYFEGEQDILKKTRQAIGTDGKLVEISNLPNNRIVDNQYKKMVIQKVNYLLGKPFLIQTKNEKYLETLNKIFNKRFYKVFNGIGTDSINCGIGWLHIYCDENSVLGFEKFSPYEIHPVWKDDSQTVVDYALRLYERTEFKNNQETTVEYVDVYTVAGIDCYQYINGGLKFIEHRLHLQSELVSQWGKVPLIPFKYNSKEIPLINMAKSLQDGINTILSNFQDNMQEDARNTIMVLINYGGENLGEFRQNLATFGAVKVDTVDGVTGDMKTVQVEVNAENYKSILSLLKKAIIENCMGYDAKDDRLAGNANQLNIQSMYSDIDLDANSMEIEYQASLEELLWFVNIYLSNMNLGEFTDENVEIIFNRDMLMNESEIIENLNKSLGILSKETIIANHPWVNDVAKEQKRIEKEMEAESDLYGDVFKKVGGSDSEQE